MILVGGENLIDFVQEPGGDGLPRYVANPGGSPFNVAMALGRQGVPVGYMTPISTDSLGDLMADRLVTDGVTLLGDRASQPSSLAVVSLADGVPTYGFYREETAERQVNADSLSAPDGAQAFHVGSLGLTSGRDAEAWETFYLAQRNTGLFTSLDPNIRAAFIKDREAYMARIERMAAVADLIKLSDEDLEWLYPDISQDDGYAHVHAMNPGGLTVLTKGAAGADARLGDLLVSTPAGRAEPFMDTVGAGDTFHGTLLAELYRRDCLSRGQIAALPEDAIASLITTAAQAAAINCSRSGCQPPTWAELS